MLHRHWTLPLAIALAAAGCAPKDSGESGELPSDQIDLPPTVVFQTNRGRITMELDRGQAPVFAAGDMARGQSLIVWAIQEGRVAARGMDEYLMGSTELP